MPKRKAVGRREKLAKRPRQTPFRRMDLRPEVRLLVYELYLEGSGSYLVHNQSLSYCAVDESRPHVQHKSTYIVSLGMGLHRDKSTYKVESIKEQTGGEAVRLLWTNRKVRAEATALVFGQPKFTFTSMFAIKPFLQDLTTAQRASIRKVGASLSNEEALEYKSSSFWSRVFDYVSANLCLSEMYVAAHWRHGGRPRDIVQLKDNDQLSWMDSISKIKGLDTFSFIPTFPDFNDFSQSDDSDSLTDAWSDSDEYANGFEPREIAMEAIITCTLAKQMLNATALQKFKKGYLWRIFQQTTKRMEREDRMIEAGYRQACAHRHGHNAGIGLKTQDSRREDSE